MAKIRSTTYYLKLAVAIILLQILIIIITAALYTLFFAFPMYAAQHPMFGAPFNTFISFTIFVFMCVAFLLDAYNSMAGFYGFSRLSFTKRKPSNPIIPLFTSYLYNIYAFAVAYSYISHIWPESFNTKSPLSTIDSIYFCVITSATIGYGDIVPVTSTAKIIVIIQTLLNLFYVIFLFSVCSTHLKERRVLINKEIEKRKQ